MAIHRATKTTAIKYDKETIIEWDRLHLVEELSYAEIARMKKVSSKIISRLLEENGSHSAPSGKVYRDKNPRSHKWNFLNENELNPIF